MICKHYYPDIIEHKSHCYCDGNLPDQWHDVRDELPDKPCLVYWDDGRCTVLDGEDSVDYAVTGTMFHVTHWMPLPLPPQQKGE